MMRTPRWLCTVMAIVLTLTGPLAFLLVPAPAAAQTPPPPAAQMPPPPPPPPPAYQSRTIIPDPAPPQEPTDAHVAATPIVNVFYIPGKIIICTAGTVVTALVLLATFGSGYRAAGRVFDEGCGGDWFVTPEHLSGKIPPRPDID